MSEYFLYIYVTAIGLCAAGLCTSSWQLVTGRPLSFGLQVEQTALAVLSVFVRVAGGSRHHDAKRHKGAVNNGRAPYWLALSTFISTVWSFFSGVVPLEFLFRV
jgi:hypothetical protein